MIPVKLSIAGFLSYQEKVELDFADFQIACVSGSNGAGKSTIFDAITWALFGIARSRDDSLINHANDEAEVVFDFEYETQEYRITRIKARNKTTLLEFNVKKEDGSYAILTEHAMRETQKRIESTLKLDYETFINAAFFLQGKADSFTQQTPGDRKKILSTILGLDQWETFRANAAEMRRTIELDIQNLNGRLENIKSELADEDARREQLAVLEKEKEEITEKRIEQEKNFEQARTLSDAIKSQQEMQNMLKNQQENAQLKIDQIQHRIRDREEEIEHFQHVMLNQEKISDGFSQLQQANQHLAEEQKKTAIYHTLSGEMKSAQLEIENAKIQLTNELEQLSTLEKETRQSEEQLQIAQNDVAILQEEMNTLAAEIAVQDNLVQQSTALQEEMQQITAENNHLKQLMQELKEKIDQIENQKSDQCPLCSQPLDMEHREQILSSYADEGKQYGDHFRENQELLKTKKTKLDELDASIKQLKIKQDQLQVKQRVFDQLQYQIEDHKKNIEKWQQNQAPQLAKVQRQLEKEDFALEAKETYKEKQEALEKLSFEPGALAQLEDIVNDLTPYEAQNTELQKALSAIEPLQREIKENQAELENTLKDLQELEKNLTEINSKLDSSSQQLPDLKSLQAELDETRSAENRIQMALGAAIQKVEVLASLKKQQKELQKEISQQNQQISALKRLEQAFSKDGVPALLIEQALPDIEEEANTMLERLSDGMMSVQFNTQSAYKDKKRADKKETLDIIISDSAGPRPYEMYSGGEAFRVNFAIRMALSKVLARRAGARLQTLVIDEGFGSQDTLGRQRLVEVINLIRGDFEKILIITHLEELKDAFSARIEVEKNSTGSKIQVVTNT